MKTPQKITVFWFLLGPIAWFVDTILDYSIFYEGGGDFMRLLITAPPSHEIYTRLVILVSFMAFGFFTSRMVSKLNDSIDVQRDSAKRLQHLSSKLLSIQEEERSRIAREIHDSIGQALVAIKFRIESLHVVAEERDPAIVESVEKIIPMVQHGIEETRRISTGLRPFILDDFGIIASIDWLCEELEHTFSTCVVKKIELEESDVPDGLKVTIFRIVQEGLNNIAKHSKASEVCVMLRKVDRGIELTVQDNGVGFEKGFVQEYYLRGFGLISMRERADLSGGDFSIASAHGSGTTIRVSWSS